MSEKNRVVLIGAGGRANAYTMYGAKEQMNLVGVADPHAGNRQTVLGLDGEMANPRDRHHDLMESNRS
jgi:shikimate 5-dehydrogenase